MLKSLAQSIPRISPRSWLMAGTSIVLAAAALSFSNGAHARSDVSFSIGIGTPGLVIGASNAYPVYTQPVYSQPAYGYGYQPQPVYGYQNHSAYGYQAQPVYVQPQPVYVQTPVYVAPRPVYYGGGYYRHHGYRGHQGHGHHRGNGHGNGHHR